jgi:hypothetical protein
MPVSDPDRILYLSVGFATRRDGFVARSELKDSIPEPPLTLPGTVILAALVARTDICTYTRLALLNVDHSTVNYFILDAAMSISNTICMSSLPSCWRSGILDTTTYDVISSLHIAWSSGNAIIP